MWLMAQAKKIIQDGHVEWNKVDLFNLEHCDTVEEEFFSARLV